MSIPRKLIIRLKPLFSQDFVPSAALSHRYGRLIFAFQNVGIWCNIYIFFKKRKKVVRINAYDTVTKIDIYGCKRRFCFFSFFEMKTHAVIKSGQYFILFHLISVQSNSHLLWFFFIDRQLDEYIRLGNKNLRISSVTSPRCHYFSRAHARDCIDKL